MAHPDIVHRSCTRAHVLHHRILGDNMHAVPDLQSASRSLIDTGDLAKAGAVQTRHSRRWFIVAPPALIGATFAVFQLVIAIAGERAAYYFGFAFYLLLGGIVLPLLLIGRDGVRSLFARGIRLARLEFANALVLLAAPVVFGLLFVFPSIVRVASGATIASLLAYAVLNGTGEEIFWRGTFAHRFPANRWLGMFYPAVVFSFWHLVPWMVFPPFRHVPALVVIAVVLPIALVYHWVAWSTGSIRWTVLSHVLTNVSGLGAMLIFAPGSLSALA